MGDGTPTPDFFNNVAAVAVVIMFTKTVTHRNRKRWPANPRALSRWHVVGVCAAVASATVALIATERGSNWAWLHGAAWISLIVAGATLVADEYLEMRAAKPRRAALTARADRSSRSATNPVGRSST